MSKEKIRPARYQSLLLGYLVKCHGHHLVLHGHHNSPRHGGTTPSKHHKKHHQPTKPKQTINPTHIRTRTRPGQTFVKRTSLVTKAPHRQTTVKVKRKRMNKKKESCDRGGTRTHNLQIRSLASYHFSTRPSFRPTIPR